MRLVLANIFQCGIINIGATVFTMHTDKSAATEIYDITEVFPTFKYAEKGNR